MSTPEELAAILEMEAMPLPDGEVRNFDDPPNENGLAMAIITVTLVIGTLCVLLRGYARLYLLRKVQIEEVLILCAYGVYVGQAYCCYLLIDTPGYFVHQWNLKLGQMIPTAHTVLLIGSFYQTVLPLLKTAILIEWLRILSPPGQTNRLASPFWWGCVSVMVLQCVWGVVCVILLNVQCNPHEAIWKVYMPRDLCFNLVPVQLTSGAVQLASDVIMLLLPQKTIWELKLSWKKRLGVSVVFGLGILACVSAAFRLGVTVTYGYDADQMYQLAPVVFWVLAETTCGFFIVCIPCLPKILKEKGIIRGIKRTLGMPVASTRPTGASKYGYGSKFNTEVSVMSRTGGAGGADAYYKLDEESGGGGGGGGVGGVGGIALSSIKGGDSMERLRRPDEHPHQVGGLHDPSKGGIVRTTQVAVRIHSDAVSNISSTEEDDTIQNTGHSYASSTSNKNKHLSRGGGNGNGW